MPDLRGIAIDLAQAVARGRPDEEEIARAVCHRAEIYRRVAYDGSVTTQLQKMKQASGPDMVILGSGSVVAQLAAEGLIDEYQIVVNPIVLGKGRTMFDGLERPLTLKRTKVRAFGNGNVLLCYEPSRT